jgi:hypothetical protein
MPFKCDLCDIHMTEKSCHNIKVIKSFRDYLRTKFTCDEMEELDRQVKYEIAKSNEELKK